MPSCVFRARGVRLFHGDCLDVLQELPELSVDLVFADPPYGLSNGGISCQSGRVVCVDKGDWDKSRGFPDDYAFHDAWIKACQRVLKPSGSLWVSGTYHSIYLCGHALLAQGWAVVNDICWVKPSPPPALACRTFTASHETLIWAKKSKKVKHRFNYEVSRTFGGGSDKLNGPDKQTRSVWIVPPPSAVEKRYGKHPTQKPEALIERIVLSASVSGDIVLDPFCGSGTTGVVARRNDRKFVGIDSDLGFLTEKAIPRIRDTLKVSDARGSALASEAPATYLTLSSRHLLP